MHIGRLIFNPLPEYFLAFSLELKGKEGKKSRIRIEIRIVAPAHRNEPCLGFSLLHSSILSAFRQDSTVESGRSSPPPANRGTTTTTFHPLVIV